jgi:LytS/YehU family sensor histidine kinase
MRWVIRQSNVLMRSLQSQIIILSLINLVFALLLGISETYSVKLLNSWLTEPVSIGSDFKQIVENTFHSFIYLFMWNSIYFIYHYIEKNRRQQVDTLKLEGLIKELELKTIKAHINPHFIFNSLNSIRALVDEDPERARRAITELSNILRSSMQADKSETVTLEKELFIVKDYLALENMRFEDRLKIEYDVDEDTLDQPVPPMMLQTLVENAIKHGISKQINGGVVRVISSFKNQYHELAVQNTGRLNGSINDGGFGISSTNDRLSLLYGNKAKFEIRQATPSLVEAKVSIPFETNLR